MKTKFIINPNAGKKRLKDFKKILQNNLNNNLFDYDISYTEKPLHAKEITKKAIKDRYQLIVSVGGDGTLNEITSELIGKDIPVGIIPSGSGNGFARHFKIHKDIIKSVQQLNNSKIIKVDSGIVNGNPFVNVSGIGFDAHIANLFSKREKRGLISYIKLILKEINYKEKEYCIEYGNKRRNIKAILISFANTSQYGNNFKISPNSVTDDGLLDFVIMKDLPKWKIPLLIYKIAKGKIYNSKYIEIIRTKNMKIITTEKIIHLDGEPKKIDTFVEIRCNKNSLNVLVPNE